MSQGFRVLGFLCFLLSGVSGFRLRDVQGQDLGFRFKLGFFGLRGLIGFMCFMGVTGCIGFYRRAFRICRVYRVCRGLGSVYSSGSQVSACDVEANYGKRTRFEV